MEKEAMILNQICILSLYLKYRLSPVGIYPLMGFKTVGLDPAAAKVNTLKGFNHCFSRKNVCLMGMLEGCL